MIALDTNLLVRLLTNDAPREAAKVEAWLQQNTSARSPAYVDHIVVCELVWVLERSYGYASAQIRQALEALLEHDHLRLEAPNLLRQALGLYSQGPADFSDYLLALRAKAAGFALVLTLDKKAAKTSTHQLLR